MVTLVLCPWDSKRFVLASVLDLTSVSLTIVSREGTTHHTREEMLLHHMIPPIIHDNDNRKSAMDNTNKGKT